MCPVEETFSPQAVQEATCTGATPLHPQHHPLAADWLQFQHGFFQRRQRYRLSQPTRPQTLGCGFAFSYSRKPLTVEFFAFDTVSKLRNKIPALCIRESGRFLFNKACSAVTSSARRHFLVGGQSGGHARRTIRLRTPSENTLALT
jgi:hypothetical protein